VGCEWGKDDMEKLSIAWGLDVAMSVSYLGRLSFRVWDRNIIINTKLAYSTTQTFLAGI